MFRDIDQINPIGKILNLSVYPTNLTSDHTTACQCQAITTQFHP